MEYIIQNYCAVKINECTEFYMDVKKTLDIISAQEEKNRVVRRKRNIILA